MLSRIVVLLGAGAVMSHAASEFGMAPPLLAEIDSTLAKTCGQECLDFWGKMRSSNGESLQRVMSDTVQKESQALDQIYTEKQSFLKDSLAEGAANACNAGRLATMATYQGINIATHVFGVVTKLVCGCVDVLTASQCFLGPVFPVCEPIDNLYNSLFSASTQTWEAVKSSTARCKVVGSPIAQ